MSHQPVKFDLPALFRELESSLAQFETDFPLAEFARSHYQQHPFATLLTCSDSRISPNMLGDTFNRVFCVENIGNQFRNNEGSILYGLLHLRTPLLLIAGHSECGAIKAATSDYGAEPEGLVRELNIVKESLQQGCSAMNIDLETAALNQAQLAQSNVDIQVEMLLKQPDVARLVETGELWIIGLLVDLHDVLGAGYGKVYTINVNGIKEVSSIRSLDNIGDFAARARRLA